LRELRDEDLSGLADYAQVTAASLVVTLPVMGRVIADDSGALLCRVDVLGRDYPHLLPEHQVWRFMFRAWSRAVDFNMETHGQIPDDYLSLLRRSVFRGMPTDDIRTFLHVAKATTVAVARLTNAPPEETGSQTSSLESNLHDAVMSGRLAVLRGTSVDGWRALIRYVDEYRGGVKAWFSAPIEP
jgi:hypothetical protein